MERRGERPRARIHMLDGRACARTRYQHFEVLNMNIYVRDHLSFAENRATTVCALWTLGAGQAPAPIGRKQGDGAARNFSWRWCPMSPEHVGPQFLVALLPVLVDTSDGFRPDHSENAETHPLGQRKSHSAPTLRGPSSAPVRCPAHMGTMQMGVGIRGTAVHRNAPRTLKRREHAAATDLHDFHPRTKTQMRTRDSRRYQHRAARPLRYEGPCCHSPGSSEMSVRPAADSKREFSSFG